MLMLLLAGCAKQPSSALEKADKLIVPAVKEYTASQQIQAANEMAAHCKKNVPMLCEFVNDYGKMRDQARAALGLTVDVKR